MLSHVKVAIKAIVLSVLFYLLLPSADGQNYRNTITFLNQSGENALVKVVGPIRGQVVVNNGGQTSVRVPGGEYFILARYCDANNRCSYSRGDSFVVEETPTQYSQISITLHPVVNGNYGSRPASAAEFAEN